MNQNPVINTVRSRQVWLHGYSLPVTNKSPRISQVTPGLQNPQPRDVGGLKTVCWFLGASRMGTDCHCHSLLCIKCRFWV